MASRWCGKHALDDPHGSAAIWADALGVGGVFVHRGRRRGSVLRLGFFIDEQSAAQSDIFGAVTVRHESEIADAVEAVGQGMKQKATNELVWLQPHDLLGAVLTVILSHFCPKQLRLGSLTFRSACNALPIMWALP